MTIKYLYSIFIDKLAILPLLIKRLIKTRILNRFCTTKIYVRLHVPLTLPIRQTNLTNLCRKIN